MEQHLQDLKCGGRPMNKNELRIKELEKENRQLKENNQNMQEEIKDLCKKFKVNERSRRKMQKSLMEKLQQKEDNINKAQEEFISEFYSCDNEEALKRLYSKLCCLKEENQQLKEQQKEFKKTLRDKLIKYFDIENDSYFYILTRDKSAYQYGTMRFDDFKEFDIEQIDDLIKFLFNKRSDE